jgi:hypothetical protein
MGYLLRTIRKAFFWNYARNSWQWDILCVLILIFIFLAPKSCFQSSERHRVSVRQSPAAKLMVRPELIENAKGKARLQKLVRNLTGRTNAEVVDVRKVLAPDGQTRGYEVDIR